jgi:hypothetical protein
MKPIDIIVPYVNCWEPSWIELLSKHVKHMPLSRVRDLGSLRYVFRGIEQNMPWIHNVYLILQSESQIPHWLNTSHPKLKIVYHIDYIPKKFLPTFNSNVIEMFYHKIKGLTKQFILANDDTIPIQPLVPDNFFHNGKLVYGHADRIEHWSPEVNHHTFMQTILNNSILAGSITGKHNRPFYKDYHLFMPELKSIYRICWKKRKSAIIHALNHGKTRSPYNVTHTLFYFVGRELNMFEDDPDYKLGLLNIEDGANPELIVNALLKSESKICCLNDNFQYTDINTAMRTIQLPLNYFLPRQSLFEK